ncbi:hypothetical protein C8N35_11057 [Breoghania corrubedonensis]|uniref:DUF2218 domain-containing protein n=1 Tax=Breoghania corrubedonensis TaxID=665038 RepID=A0A2T5V1H6_9HYPH|nr:DUF2218 domain-containing protein [Breoghania corrubedonensis]PTW57578.1 hypothetical protein C8N35_11057 [Breoghania corrubedonensis]
MTVHSTAIVPTQSASRYLQQLCKHWSHNLQVGFSPEKGEVVFPASGRSGEWPGEGRLTLAAGVDHLRCDLEASVPEQLEALKGVVQSHLDRFAFREAPLAFDWKEWEGV